MEPESLMTDIVSECGAALKDGARSAPDQTNLTTYMIIEILGAANRIAPPPLIREAVRCRTVRAAQTTRESQGRQTKSYATAHARICCFFSEW